MTRGQIALPGPARRCPGSTVEGLRTRERSRPGYSTFPLSRIEGREPEAADDFRRARPAAWLPLLRFQVKRPPKTKTPGSFPPGALLADDRANLVRSCAGPGEQAHGALVLQLVHVAGWLRKLGGSNGNHSVKLLVKTGIDRVQRRTSGSSPASSGYNADLGHVEFMSQLMIPGWRYC